MEGHLWFSIAFINIFLEIKEFTLIMRNVWKILRI